MRLKRVLIIMFAVLMLITGVNLTPRIQAETIPGEDLKDLENENFGDEIVIKSEKLDGDRSNKDLLADDSIIFTSEEAAADYL